MAIAIVQSNFVSNPFTGVTSGTATGSLPNPVASGNAVLLGFAGAGGNNKTISGAVLDDKSNTYSQVMYDNTTTNGQGWFLLTNITNGPHTAFNIPFTIAISSPTIVVAVYELSGVDPSPVEVATLTSSTFATTFNRPITTAAANEYGFALLSNANGSGQTAVTMTSGPPTWTLDNNSLAGGVTHSAFASVALPSSGSNAIAGSTSAGDTWNISIVTLKQGSNPSLIAPFTRNQIFVTDTIVQM